MDSIQDHLHQKFHDQSLAVKVPQVTIFFWVIKILCTTVGETLAIHSIHTPRREAFYWLAILFTFALGTAAGDLLAERMSLGYGISFFIFAAGIALFAAGWKAKIVDPVLAFWAIYILTRPLGASIGDQLSQAKADGGWGPGTTTTSMIFLLAILGLVAYLVRSKRDQIVLAA